VTRSPVPFVAPPDGYTIRHLASHEERAEAVRIQEETWGQGFTERVPAAILLVGPKLGGVTGGAFDTAGRMVGFVFGLTGPRDGALAHWSDMLAVRPEAQRRRLGEALKHWQRAECRAIGVAVMYWTFDPFVARNAHLNLNLLGAGVHEFVADMYGRNTGSRVHGTLGTDRFVASWAVRGELAPMPADPALLVGAPIAAGPPGECPAPHDALPEVERVAVRIPTDYHHLLEHDLERARPWRLAARRAFQHYLTNGYRVTAFVPDRTAGATYLLTRSR
jgi:predicted GNAT superfamily acetyltransferase